jgi:hypothetical protein
MFVTYHRLTRTQTRANIFPQSARSVQQHVKVKVKVIRITNDGQSASLSWRQEPNWVPRPNSLLFNYFFRQLRGC